MTGKTELLTAVNALEATFQRSAQLGRENFQESKKEVIQLRREIAALLADVHASGLAIDDPAFNNAFRIEFSKMRSAMALHHASWPVVAIDLSDPSYRASIQTQREACRNFFTWVRSRAL